MWDRRTPLQAYHAAKSLTPRKAEGVVQRAADAARIKTDGEIRNLIEEIQAAGHKLQCGGVVLGSRGVPKSLPATGISHAGAHFAEGEMYRGALLDALEACGLRATGVREKDLESQASDVLGIDDPMTRVTELGRELGPPWTKDHKHAALVAWLALAAASSSRGPR